MRHRGGLMILFVTLLVSCNAEIPGWSSAPEAPPMPEPPRVQQAPEALEQAGPLAFPPPTDTLAATADTYYTDCGEGTAVSMADLLPAITDRMVRQRIPYSQGSPDEWRDCSGNFLRLSSYLASACPGAGEHLAAPRGIADYTAAGPNTPGLRPRARSTRELARLAHDAGRFVPVWYDDAVEVRELSSSLEASRHLIKPGAVLWFSKNGPRQEQGLEQLFTNHTGTHISHMGTVTQVKRDPDGRVVSYAMFHGRNGRKVASITQGHKIRKRGNNPPFGNGGQYLVGIGALLPLAPPPEPVPSR